jgi:hypothetical protein
VSAIIVRNDGRPGKRIAPENKFGGGGFQGTIPPPSRSFPMRLYRFLSLPTLFISLTLGLSACAAFTVPAPPPVPAPGSAVWDNQELTSHLRFLNSEDVGGRATATQGYARAAAYVAARMREFRLQPVLDNDYRVVYHTEVNYPSAALLWTSGVDSTIFLPGLDFVPGGRSDSGRVHLHTLIVSPDSGRLRESGRISAGEAVMLPAALATLETLVVMRDAGASAALIVGPLEPRIMQRPIDGLLVARITERTARTLLGSPSDLFTEHADVRVPLPRIVHLRITTEYHRRAGAINTLGYVAGKDPVHARDLVLVCADLDAVGQFAGIRTLDFANFGLGTAGLLEVARNVAYVGRRWSMPDRSILFAVWSGARFEHAGLRAFLRHPTWDVNRIKAVIYIGLDASEAPMVRDVLAVHGIPLYVVPPPVEPLHEPQIVMLPPVLPRQLAREQPNPPAPPPLSQIVTRGVEEARHMAEQALRLAMRESMTSRAPMPDLPAEPFLSDL